MPFPRSFRSVWLNFLRDSFLSCTGESIPGVSHQSTFLSPKGSRSLGGNDFQTGYPPELIQIAGEHWVAMAQGGSGDFLVIPLRGVTHLLALRAAGLIGPVIAANGCSLMPAASVIDGVRYRRSDGGREVCVCFARGAARLGMGDTAGTWKK